MDTFKKCVALGFFIGVLAVVVAAVTLAQQRGERDRMDGRMEQENRHPDLERMEQGRREHRQRRGLSRCSWTWSSPPASRPPRPSGIVTPPATRSSRRDGIGGGWWCSGFV